MHKKFLLFILPVLTVSAIRAQEFDIGLHFFSIKQEGTLLHTTYNPGVYEPFDYVNSKTRAGGHFGVYLPLFFDKRDRFSAGPESGLYFAYSSKRNAIDPDYIALKESQSGIVRSIGILDVPVMASLRTGRFSGGLNEKRWNFGISAGMHLIHLYVPDERGTYITPAVSAMIGLTKHAFIRFDILPRPYQSEYVTSLGTLPRITSRCRVFSLNIAL